MKRINRRNFLKSSLSAGAAIGFTAKSSAAVKGSNSSIRVGVVGFKGRGQLHLRAYRELKADGVRVVGLCDVDSSILNANVQTATNMGETVGAYQDIRKMLEREQLDVVSIATPNHWHSLAAIWAIQAGADVYVEKPVSHNVWEGRKLVEAARKYDRMVQVGTQSRSSRGIAEAIQWVAQGNLGKIIICRGLCYKRRGSIGKTAGPQEVPATIDYDLWCGPAPLNPPRRNGRQGPVHYDWHWFWDYGNGDLGNQGIHQMDIARRFLGENEISPRVWSVGGRLGYEDDAETPNTQIVYHEYKKGPLIFEVRGLPSVPAGTEQGGSKIEKSDLYKGSSVGVVVECEGGYVSVPDHTAAAFDKDGMRIREFKGSSGRFDDFDARPNSKRSEAGTNDHFDNFISAVKSRRRTDLRADIWEGHVSSALCHTGNISYRLGQKSSPAEMMEQIKGMKGVDETVGRMVEHLAKNHVDISRDKLTIGPVLDVDSKVEKFIGRADADRLLRREYRAPFVVPERV